MPFSVKSERADALLAELREITGEGITECVVTCLEERLRSVRRHRGDSMAFLHSIWERYPQLTWQPGEPELSVTFNEQMYDDEGLPT